ncbi:MAG: hypothetical protein RhofKO_29150 [Rhodothermales bacterium]
MHERDEQELHRFSQQLKQAGTPDPAEAYWEGYYHRLLTRKHAEAQPKRRSHIYRWTWRLAIAMLLVVGGIVVGRYSAQPEPMPRAAIGAERPEVRAQAVRMLGRTEVLFLGLAHAKPSLDDPAMAQIERKRVLASELLAEMQALRTELDPGTDGLLLDLLNELEVLLLEVANLNGIYDVPGVERVQQGIEQRGTMLHLHQSQLDLNESLPIS